MKLFIILVICVALANAISISSNPELSGRLNPRVKPSCTRVEVERPSKYQMEESKLSSEQYEQEEECEGEEEEEYLLNENPEQFFFNNRLVKTFLHEPVDLEWIYEQSQQLRQEEEQEQEPQQKTEQQQFGEQRIQPGLPEQFMIPINPKLQELLECYRNKSQNQLQQQQQGQQQRDVEHTGEGVKMMPQNEQTMTESVTSSEFEQNPPNQNYLYVILPIRITGENTQQQEQQNIQSGLGNIY